MLQELPVQKMCKSEGEKTWKEVVFELTKGPMQNAKIKAAWSCVVMCVTVFLENTCDSCIL